MKVLLDTCVWGGVRSALSAGGYDVLWAGDWPTDPGDEEILDRANRDSRTLVTLDKDFGELAIVRRLPHGGIVRLVALSTSQQVEVCLGGPRHVRRVPRRGAQSSQRRPVESASDRRTTIGTDTGLAGHAWSPADGSSTAPTRTRTWDQRIVRVRDQGVRHIRAIVTGCALAVSVSANAACQSAQQSDAGKDATAGTIAITTPAPNTVFHPGDPVTVTVQPSGFTPVRMLITVTDSDAEVLTSSPWTTTLPVSQDALGPAMIRAVAFDTSNNSIRIEIPIQVAATTAALRALTVSPNSIGLFAGMLEQQLHVTGHYSDGIDRDISNSAAGTLYESQGQAIVTVSPNGLTTGVGLGSTTIVVRNGSSQANVAVRVKSLPAPLTFSGKSTLSWPAHTDAVGYDVVRGDLNGLQSSSGRLHHVDHDLCSAQHYGNDPEHPGSSREWQRILLPVPVPAAGRPWLVRGVA